MWVIFENSLNHFSALYSDLLDEWFYAVMNGHRSGWGSTAFIQILKILLGYRYIECLQPHSLDSLFLFSTCLAKSQQALSLTLCLFSYSSWTSLEKKKTHNNYDPCLCKTMTTNTKWAILHFPRQLTLWASTIVFSFFLPNLLYPLPFHTLSQWSPVLFSLATEGIYRELPNLPSRKCSIPSTSVPINSTFTLATQDATPLAYLGPHSSFVHWISSSPSFSRTLSQLPWDWFSTPFSFCKNLLMRGSH